MWRGVVRAFAHNEAPLAPLRRVLDARIVGQADAKDAVLLGLISREHVYIEGAPGQGKTAIAELTQAAVAGLTCFTSRRAAAAYVQFLRILDP